jgi:hypothetical protein
MVAKDSSETWSIPPRRAALYGCVRPGPLAVSVRKSISTSARKLAVSSPSQTGSILGACHCQPAGAHAG